ncbi:N-acetylmuramoyl-L-alanine amidase [Streptomyces odontomachi]|uniref:N-acetylmuramoyl-L-alanine amidase n=1 Tax=Streptomyces odontomachi TaxID=2944940 RepID=UPI00210DAA84|nr:peptidoglycan recognition family protein [Streptomyces sp. ODS25]
MTTKPGGPARGPGQSGGSGAQTQGIGRRTAVIAGGLGVLAAAGLAMEELRRVWWRLPGIDKPRTPGAVDFSGAAWTAASPANWRRADRPDDYAIDRVVIHVTQGSYRSAVRAFQDPQHRASAHYLVGRDGHITQFVRELDVAFHAGNRGYNERSVGIEHEGYVTDPSFPDVMYRASARLTARICGRYDIPVDRTHIIGHSEVPGADHTDPGPHWDWDHYLRLVRQAADAARGD